MGGVSGDFGQLARLQAQVARLGPEGGKRLLRAVANEAQALVEEGFEAGRAPDGAPWAPVKRGGQPLRDTGRLLASLTPRLSGSGFTIETNLVYAGVHQYGATITSKGKRSLGTPSKGFFGVTVTVPPRPFLPTGPALPGPWEARLAEAAEDALALLFR